jgi:hypothetical protein
MVTVTTMNYHYPSPTVLVQGGALKNLAGQVVHLPLDIKKQMV